MGKMHSMSIKTISMAALASVSLSSCGLMGDALVENIVVPPGMSVEEPIDERAATWGRQEDAEVGSLYVVKAKSMGKAGVEIDNLKLPQFDGERRELLVRHLATSCKWRVTEEGGRIYAVRREVDENGNWITSLNGYVSRQWEPSGHSQYRTVIGIDGPIYQQKFHAQKVKAIAGNVAPTIGNSVNNERESYFCDSFGPHMLEIFEETPFLQREYTNAELRLLNTELSQLNSSPTARSRGFDPHLMPAFSMGLNKAELKVRNSDSGGGIYFVDAFVNPGESGKTYLKVFEATRNTRLSADRVSKDSLEYIGWSNNSRESFFYDSLIRIDEGNWHTFYPARFELWFQPSDKSKPERKLLERTFRICGWER